jgi:hypothetical protein
VEYDQPEHGNENHQTPETEDADECETFAEADLDMPKWSNWKNEDRNINEGVLSQWLDLSNWRNKFLKGTYKCCWYESKDGFIQTFDCRMGGWIKVGV